MAEFRDVPDFLDGGSPAVGPPPPAALPGSAAPTRAELQKRRARALAASGAWFAVQLAVFGLRRDFGELPGYYLAALIAGPLAAGLFAIVLSLHPGRLGLGVRTPLVVALAFLAPAAFVATALATPLPGDAASSAGLPGVVCLNAIVAWTLLPMASAALVLRRSFATGAAYRSALFGAGVGLVSGALFALHCPIVERLHVAIAHGSAVAVAALAGGLLLARVTRI